jgi:hypothetical protein
MAKTVSGPSALVIPSPIRDAQRTVLLDPNAEGPGVRGWFASLGQMKAKAAAFDTRFGGPGALTGRASKGIARGLRRHGFDVVAKPASFFIDKDNQFRPGEEGRAVAWAQRLASKVEFEVNPTVSQVKLH